jgi:integrase
MKPPKVKSKPHRSWTDGEIAAYELAHPIGSTARLALALGGQRRSDVVRMGRQHIRDGILTIGQQKTGAQVDIPVIDRLRTIIDATPSDHLTFLTKKSGEPYSGTSFNYAFRHGLRASSSWHSSPVMAPQDPSGFPPARIILAKTSREDFSYAHASRTAALLGLWTRIMSLRPMAKAKPP